jgi:hypothetical protein
MFGTIIAVLGARANASAAVIPGQFFGQSATVEAQAIVGPVSLGIDNAAAESCPCSGTNGVKRVSRVSALSIGVAGTTVSATTANSTAYALKTSTGASSVQTSTISKLNLLNGLITADVIKASASIAVSPTALTPSFTGSSLANLVVAGKKIAANVAPNTAITLAGIGTLTVKFVQTGTYGTQAAGIEVEMLRVDIGQSNQLGLPVGAVLVVGEASAGFYRVQPAASLGGYADSLAVSANAGALLQETAVAGAFAGIGSCTGTNGPVSQSVATLSVPNLLSLGTNISTANAGPSGKSYVARTTATVADVALLGGLITATNVVAVAQETRTGTVSTPSTVGTTFGDLVVAGVPISADVAPNTVITLPAIGYVVLNEQPTPTAGHVQVSGLHIVVNVANQLGLPVGAEIFISHAEADATAF